MKKALCLLLAFLMSAALLPGCKEETPQSSSDATQSSSDATQSSSDATQSSVGENTEQRVVNGVYASCGDYKYTIRTTANASIQFYLVTEKPLPKDAAITVDTESSYWFKIVDKTPKQAYADYLPELAMWAEYGADYDVVYDWYEEVIQLNSDYLDKKIATEEYDKLYKSYQVTWDEQIEPIYSKAWKEHYEKAPPCYLYLVELHVRHKKDEVIKECQLVAGDMSRTIQIGEITQLYEEDPHMFRSEVVGTGAEWIANSEISKIIPDISVIRSGFSTDYLTGDSDYPSPQSGYLSDTVYFTAKNDIALKDVQSLDGYYDIKAAELAVVGNNGTTMLSWTPGTELRIRKGETVVLRVYFDNPDFHGVECSVRDELRIFYDDANGGGYIRQVHSFLRKRPLMEMYLWAFKGIDTQSFCERYREYQRFQDKHPGVGTKLP